ncbi:MAG TPA: histidine phosphatase family protein [Candidatus Binatia bacterium]|nr:histidine phosphatase family protein [Candidatus Binatia bacterium]
MTASDGLLPAGLDVVLVLLRHGETEYIAEGRFQGHAETPLTALGREQARLAGVRLAEPSRPPALPVPAGPPLEIVHSPLRRAAETAAIVAEAIGSARAGSGGGDTPERRPTETPTGPQPRPRLVAEPGFTEIGQGAWEGLSMAEIERRYGPILAGWRRRPTEVWAPGGEPLTAVAERVRAGLAALFGRLPSSGRVDPAERAGVAGYADAEAPAERPWVVVVGHDGCFKVLLCLLFGLPLERFWSFRMALCGLSVVELSAGRPVLLAFNRTEHLAALEGAEGRAEAESDARARRGAL